MKIVLNPNGLIPNNSWQFFRKVRAIIEDDKGHIAITIEGGKYIFPGGKCENNENDIVAIQREINEELGINFINSDFHKILELETFYDDFYDYRTKSIKPRYTKTIYYYAKTKRKIDKKNLNLTSEEQRQNFKSIFINKNKLIDMLLEDHSTLENGRFFDEENKIIVEKFLKNR